MDREWKFDYLKAFGIICVIIMHIWQLGYGDNRFLKAIFAFLFSMIIPMFMIISGYFYTVSWEKQQFVRLRDYYCWKNIARKLIRIVIPFLIVYGFQVIYVRIIMGWDWMNVQQSLFWCVQGGFGPGSYYTPVLIQIIFIFPILYLVFKKNKIWGSFAILALQLLLEIVGRYMNMGADSYRLLAFRYFVFLWAGIILYHEKHRIRKVHLAVCTISGGLYIYLITFTQYNSPIFRYWTDCAMPTVLWILPISIMVLNHLKRVPDRYDKILRKIGTSTYSIYLVQMIFYHLKINERIPGIVLQIVINCIVCLGIGVFINKYVFEPLIKKTGSIFKVL